MEKIYGILDEIKRKLVLSSKEVFTLQEFAEYAGIAVQTAYKYTSQRKISHFKRGKHLYLKREDVIEFLLSNPISSEKEIEQQAQKVILNQTIK